MSVTSDDVDAQRRNITTEAAAEGGIEQGEKEEKQEQHDQQEQQQSE